MGEINRLLGGVKLSKQIANHVEAKIKTNRNSVHVVARILEKLKIPVNDTMMHFKLNEINANDY